MKWPINMHYTDEILKAFVKYKDGLLKRWFLS